MRNHAKGPFVSKHRNWTRDELILAINLYCKIPFGKIHNRNPKVIRLAEFIDRTANSVSYKLANFASIDPSLPQKGASNFSKLDVKVWNEFFNNGEDLVYESELLLAKCEQDKPANLTELKIPIGKEKDTIVKTRINQSFFRKTILATYDFKCCLTDISKPELLVASHIVPWSIDKKNRMNPRNGLCLNALHDKAFDAGLITISDDYLVILSKRLESNCICDFEKNAFLELKNRRISIPNRFLPDKDFIAYHRKNTFIG